MHATAQQMAGLMAGQSALVMNGSEVSVDRFRTMMATINSNMPSIVTNAVNGLGMNSAFMTSMMTNMQTRLGAMPVSGGFTNFTGMFRNMTGHSRFWTNTGTPVTPVTGGVIR